MKFSSVVLSGLTVAMLMAGCASQSTTSGTAVTPGTSSASSAPPATVANPAKKVVAAAPQKVISTLDVYFDYRKAVLNTQTKKEIDDLLTKTKDIKLEVISAIGHTGGKGSVAANEKMSLKRSNAVKDYLISKGIAANKIYVDTKADAYHMAGENQTDGHPQNRRVEIEIIGYRTK